MVPAAQKEEAIAKLRTISQAEVAEILGCSREYVSRLTNHKNENKRLPAFAWGSKSRRYDPQEVMWWKEKHRYVPSKRRNKK